MVGDRFSVQDAPAILRVLVLFLLLLLLIQFLILILILIVIAFYFMKTLPRCYCGGLPLGHFVFSAASPWRSNGRSV